LEKSYLYGNVEENEMESACPTHGRDKNTCRVFVGKHEEKNPLENVGLNMCY
jgi:hypothetical protein